MDINLHKIKVRDVVENQENNFMPENNTSTPKIKINDQETPIEELEVNTEKFFELLEKAIEN